LEKLGIGFHQGSRRTVDQRPEIAQDSDDETDKQEWICQEPNSR
jgi:hypothetical protein